MNFFTGFYIATIISSISAFPSLNTRNTTTTVELLNQCDGTIHVGQLGDTILNDGNILHIVSGSSKTYHFNGQWSGRFWARKHCEASGCKMAGAAFPASLAEFTFHGDGGSDFYDISFVDGYNLPIRIEPIQPDTTINEKYWCGSPSCNVAPHCPSELKLVSVEDGTTIGCQSACSKFGNPKYCCSGANDTPGKCPINIYAAAVKNTCPDVYSYAYDDASSLYECKASGYTVTWCPK